MQLDTLIKSTNALLTPERFHDYAPNGLQVEGRQEVRRIVTGVSACLDLILAARERSARPLPRRGCKKISLRRYKTPPRGNNCRVRRRI